MNPGAVPVLFSAGFRLFFLLAACTAIAVIARTTLVLNGAITVSGNPFGWHGHEMLFGYVGAVVVGFILTAVPNWTGTRPARGLPIFLLGTLWLLARIALWDGNPGWWGHATDLAFLPAAAVVAAMPLWRHGNPRQWLPIGVILTIAAANIPWHLAVHLGQPALASRALAFTTMLIALLIAIIGGRVVPAFTRNRLATSGEPLPRGHDIRDGLAIGASFLVAIAELAAPTAAGALALIAAGLHAARLHGWRGLRVTGDPLLFVLHVGYAWLALGYAVRALALISAAGSSAWALHGILVGAIGTMTLAMMSRATLGHTGRALRAGPVLTAAFIAMQLAVLARLGAPWLGFEAWIVAGMLWSMAFACYILRCAPMLLRPRPASAG